MWPIVASFELVSLDLVACFLQNLATLAAGCRAVETSKSIPDVIKNIKHEIEMLLGPNQHQQTIINWLWGL